MPQPKILVIGDIESWQARGRQLPDDEQLAFADFPGLNQTLLDQLRPAVILSPLTAERFDALDMAQRLKALGFGGAYRVLCPRLPDPDMVIRELSKLAPGLDCELIQIARPPELKLI